MLHLAQVEKIESSGKLGLRLIACQRSEYAWAVISAQEAETIACDEYPEYGAGTLVLATLSETRQIMQVESANHWLIDIIHTFLRSGITPAFLQEEAERAEHWRQMLTLQSQDLDRRALELEARREQIEQLEETLKREKKHLETLAAQYQQQTQELDRRNTEVKALQQQIEQLQATLKPERQKMAEILPQPEKNTPSAS